MPKINPVTKDQLFEKKIAENTGSDYNVGDISDVVPVTKDQALLKEIALNSAGQSGDITELKGKVRELTEKVTKKSFRIMGVYTKDHTGQFALFCPYDVVNKGLPTVVSVDLRYKGTYSQGVTIQNNEDNGFWVSASDAPQSNEYLGYLGEAICS